MGMRLSPEQLAEIASEVEKLDGGKVEVKEIELNNHRIFLSKQVGSHMVVGISLSSEQKSGGTTLR